MRKRVISHAPPDGERWLDITTIAAVEISSEAPAHPIEQALTGDPGGWRAAVPGEQVIRLLFDEPTRLRAIDLRFDEHGAGRTQEFVVRWSADGGRTYRDVVRQQYTFTPPGTTCEAERYTVQIDGATALELRIVPDIAGGTACASLSRLRVS